MIDGKSQAWRDAADKLLEALARENKYIVSDILIVFLESAGYGLDDYSPLGGVFKRAAKRGIIKKIDRPTKQSLWLSKLYGPASISDNLINQPIYLEGFGSIVDGAYAVIDQKGDTLQLKRVKDA